MRRTIAALVFVLAACASQADAETTNDICHSLDAIAADTIAQNTSPYVDREPLDDIGRRALRLDDPELAFAVATIAAGQDTNDLDLIAEGWDRADKVCNP